LGTIDSKATYNQRSKTPEEFQASQEYKLISVMSIVKMHTLQFVEALKQFRIGPTTACHNPKSNIGKELQPKRERKLSEARRIRKNHALQSGSG
jgi:hypothetical protein